MVYGTLEPIQEEKRTTTHRTVLAVCAFAVVAVFGLAATGKISVHSEVDTNRGRIVPVPVSNLVQGAFQKVCDRSAEATEDTTTIVAEKEVTIKGQPAQMRFAIAGLKASKEAPKFSLVPYVSYESTDDWTSDWKTFTDMMPRTAPAIGFGVYNFPVWNDAKQLEFTMYSTFVSYSAKNAALHNEYLGGTFLGSALLAASGSLDKDATEKRACTVTSIRIDETTTYEDACVKVVMNKPGNKLKKEEIKTRCKAVTIDGCVLGEVCDSLVCKDVVDWKGDSDNRYPAACCTAINAVCNKATVGKISGCSRYQLATYTRNCDAAFDDVPTSSPLVLLGTLAAQNVCKAECQQPCSLLEKTTTYKSCSGCQTDKKKHKYQADMGAFVAVCDSQSDSFLNYQCCGAANCAGGTEGTCATFSKGDDSCTWQTHELCSKRLADAQAAADAAAAAAAPKVEAPVVAAEAEKTEEPVVAVA